MSIIGALALPVMIGFVSLVAEYGHGLVIRAEDQRVADLAAYAGALAYNTAGTTAAVTSAADAVANLNGIPSAEVNATLATSPTGDGAQSVRVTVSSSLQLYLARVVGGGASLPMSATAYAEMKSQATPCIVALSANGAGITMSGSGNATANACAVASNSTMTIPNGTCITTQWASYNSGTAPVVTTNCSSPGGVKAPSGKTATVAKKSATDPLAGSAPVTAAQADLSAATGISPPATGSGAAVTSLDWSGSPRLPSGCTVQSWSSGSGTYVISCSGYSSYTFASLTLAGGITASFTSAATYVFNSSVSCQGANYSLCNTGASLSFAGPSSFTVANGIFNGGGATLTMGGGSTSNSFNIGPSSSGAALTQNGAAMVMGDATGGSSLFQATGAITTGGGGCTTLSAAAQHNINGSMSLAGGTTLGAGVYSVTGYVAFGANGGGDVTCNGSSVGVTGQGVTFVVGGATAASGNCSGASFCVSAGFGHVTLTAPTSGATAGLVVLGPTSSTITAGASFNEGASGNSLSGAFYFPYGPISLSGAASVGGGSGQCLELVGSQITLSGGTAAATTCISGSGAGSGSGALLVQ